MIIKTAEFICSSPKVQSCPKDNLPEYAFIGRSNVGKSTLINILTNQLKLAKTSGTPGKTQLINHFLINNSWYLVDLPGYGYAKASKNNKKNFSEIIEQYILKRESLHCLFVLIDSRHKPLKIDIDFINWLGNHMIAFAIVFTKTDKLSANQLKENQLLFEKELLENWDELPPFYNTSSVHNVGREDILNYIDKINHSNVTN
jgi:GTP-binding protein